MKILITLSETDPGAWDTATEDEQRRVIDAHIAFDAAVAERGELLAGAALTPPAEARTLHLRAGDRGPARVVTLGPYAETAEQLTGVYVVDLPDVDTAVELCRILPEGYTIGIRAAITPPGY